MGSTNKKNLQTGRGRNSPDLAFVLRRRTCPQKTAFGSASSPLCAENKLVLFCVSLESLTEHNSDTKVVRRELVSGLNCDYVVKSVNPRELRRDQRFPDRLHEFCRILTELACSVGGQCENRGRVSKPGDIVNFTAIITSSKREAAGKCGSQSFTVHALV